MLPLKKYFRLYFILLLAILLTSCAPDDMLWPSNKIGSMWVNRYGHSNSQPIWEFCPSTLTETPGVQTVTCTVPWVDELFIGYGVSTENTELRDALWNARDWELYIDGYAVDLPAFNIADFYEEENGEKIYYRVWRIRLRNIPAGEHTLRYVIHVNEKIENDPMSQSTGTYELIVNFTFEEK